MEKDVGGLEKNVDPNVNTNPKTPKPKTPKLARKTKDDPSKRPRRKLEFGGFNIWKKKREVLDLGLQYQS